MAISIKVTGGITLVGVLCMVGAVMGDYIDKVENKYWKLFWLGVAITVLGVFLIIKTGGDNN